MNTFHDLNRIEADLSDLRKERSRDADDFSRDFSSSGSLQVALEDVHSDVQTLHTTVEAMLSDVQDVLRELDG